MSEKRVVVDTNVVVSALTAGGTPQKVLQAWISGMFLAVVSEELRREINEVLSRSNLISFDHKRRILLGTLFNQALSICPKRIIKPIFPDGKGKAIIRNLSNTLRPPFHFQEKIVHSARITARMTGILTIHTVKIELWI